MSNWPAPCVLCGYNGPGFYQPSTHPCMKHATERDALLAEIERLRADKDRLHGILRDIEYDKDKVAERQRDACAAAVDAHGIRSEWGTVVRATPLVTEGKS